MPGNPKVVATRTVTAGPQYKNVVLRLNRVHCESTTGEWGQDEITVGALKLHGQVTNRGGKSVLGAKASRGETIHVGKFKKGETRNLAQPKELARFPYGSADLEWPRKFIASIALVEKDGGQVGKLLEQLANRYEDQLKDYAQELVAGAGAMIGGALGTAIPVPVVGTVLGSLAGTALDKGIEALRKAKNDDLIEVDRVGLALERAPGAKGVLNGERDVVAFTGRRSKYVLTFTWEVE